MLSFAQRVSYLSTSFWKRLIRCGLTCPNCGSDAYVVEDTKYLVTELRRCERCRLMYRAPTDSDVENRRFYQAAYQEGVVTRLPAAEQLERLLAEQFKGGPYDYSYPIRILQALGLGSGDRVLDFGCSWGYGTWQLRAAGFAVVGYEISRPRAAFGREALGLDIREDVSALDVDRDGARAFDCLFSSHVVEHVPRPATVLALARKLVRPGGYFVALTPNGSEEFRRRHPDRWHCLWGKVHPNMIDPEFWRAALRDRPLLLGTSPLDLEAVRVFAGGSPAPALPMDGDELVCIARM